MRVCIYIYIYRYRYATCVYTYIYIYVYIYICICIGSPFFNDLRRLGGSYHKKARRIPKAFWFSKLPHCSR